MDRGTGGGAGDDDCHLHQSGANDSRQKETWKTKNEKVWIGGQEAELTLGFGKRRRQLQPLTNPTKICNN